MAGGGNDWDSLAWDAKYDNVLFATGNGSPHPHKFRSAGKGDNLFLCSIVAVDTKTGKYKWHYQEIPGRGVGLRLHLADDPRHPGNRRQDARTWCAARAPRTASFYVIDRETGELISAKPYMPMNWGQGAGAQGPAGRILYPDAEPQVKPHLITPGSGGGHNWNPMSFSPLTGLVYIPMMEGYMVESDRRGRPIQVPAGPHHHQPGLHQRARAARPAAPGGGRPREGLHAGLGPGEAARGVPHPLPPMPAMAATMTTGGQSAVRG